MSENIDITQNDNKLLPIDFLLIIVFAIAFFGYKLGGIVPLSDHEGLVGVTARETLQGHWLVPHFDGQIRLQKTPGMYWAVAILAKCFGQLNEFVIRLPSAISACGVALLIGILAAKMFRRVTGIIAALATASSAGMLWQSHRGIADMLMTFFVTACFVCIYLGLKQIEEQNDSASFKYFIGAYITFALGMLAKGPVPAPVVLIPITIYLIWSGHWRNWKKFHLIIGLIICLVIIGAWVVPVLINVENAVWRWKAEYISRFTGGFAKATDRPAYYYIPQIFLLTLPWGIFLPAGIALTFNKQFKEKQRELMFIFLWFICGFIFFSLSKGKRAHYILPIVPPAILLSVTGMIYLLEIKLDKRLVAKISIIVLSLICLTLAAGYFFYFQRHWPELGKYYIILAVIIIVGLTLSLELYLHVNLLSSVTVIAVMCGIIFALIWPIVPKVSDPARNPKRAAKLIAQKTGKNAEIYFIGKANAPLIYYFGRNIPQIPDSQQIVDTILKAKNPKDAKIDLMLAVVEKVMSLIEKPKKRFFITSDVRYPLAISWAKQRGKKIYEVLRIPRFFAKDKGLVVFSNLP